MKVVNFESVISNLEEHLRNNAANSQRLLFRQRRNNNVASFIAEQVPLRNTSEEHSLRRKYIIRP